MIERSIEKVIFSIRNLRRIAIATAAPTTLIFFSAARCQTITGSYSGVISSGIDGGLFGSGENMKGRPFFVNYSYDPASFVFISNSYYPTVVGNFTQSVTVNGITRKVSNDNNIIVNPPSWASYLYLGPICSPSPTTTCPPNQVELNVDGLINSTRELTVRTSFFVDRPPTLQDLGVASGYCSISASIADPPKNEYISAVFDGFVAPTAAIDFLDPQTGLQKALVPGVSQEVVVGEQVKLSFDTGGLGQPTSQTWSIVGGRAVGGYDASASSGSIIPLNTKQAELTLYFTAPSPKNTSFNITLKAILPNRQILVGNAAFLVDAAPVPLVVPVEKPNVIPCNANGTNYCDIYTYNFPDSPALLMGFGNVHGYKNIGFYATTSSSSSSAGTGGPNLGSFEWVQLISQDQITETVSGVTTDTCGGGLDGSYPYPNSKFIPGAFSMDDSPAVRLGDSQSSKERSFQATTYLLWTSSLPRSIPVPTGHVTWAFTEQTMRLSNDNTFKGWSTPVVNSVQGAFVTDKTTYPIWKNKSNPSGKCP